MNIIEPCRRTGSPPCDKFVLEPDAVLGDADRWPNHLCQAVACSSTRRWAHVQAERHYGTIEGAPDTVKAWADTWPLPVGQPLVSKAAAPPPLLPFPLPIKAALIFESSIPFVSVTAFAMVDDHPTVQLATSGAAHHQRVTMQFITVGWTDERVIAFQERATRWWTGNKATGRNRGRTVTRESAIAAYLDYSKRLKRAPKQVELAYELGCSIRTLRDVVKWGALESEAEATMRHEAKHAQQVREMVEWLTRESGK